MFQGCPRASGIWEGVNTEVLSLYGIQQKCALSTALNPGLDLSPSGKVVSSLAAVVVRHIWLDYCSRYFGNKVIESQEVLLNAIQGVLDEPEWGTQAPPDG